MELIIRGQLYISTNLVPTGLYSYSSIYLHDSFCMFLCLFIGFFCCLVLGANVSLIWVRLGQLS
jgi:hypothetical protein